MNFPKIKSVTWSRLLERVVQMSRSVLSICRRQRFQCVRNNLFGYVGTRKIHDARPAYRDRDLEAKNGRRIKHLARLSDRFPSSSRDRVDRNGSAVADIHLPDALPTGAIAHWHSISSWSRFSNIDQSVETSCTPNGHGSLHLKVSSDGTRARLSIIYSTRWSAAVVINRWWV